MRNVVLLVDLVGDTVGHYCMMQALSELDNTIIINTFEHKIKIRKSPIRAYLERYRMLNRVIHEVHKYDQENVIVHFLTGDKFYVIPIFRSLERKRRRVIVNIHTSPRSFIQKLLLKNFSKRITTYVACSEYGLRTFQKLGIRNVVSIPWPSFYDYTHIETKEILRKKKGIEDDKIVITALGGIRYEKGLDILLSAYSYLSDGIKERVVLNIAGKPYGDLSMDLINSMIVQNGIRTICKFDALSEEEFCENVMVSDIMVFPYRKSFKGVASGPLTEAMSQGIPCIFPKDGPLGYYDRYHIGETFDAEDPCSLAMAIERLINNPYSPQRNFMLKYTRQGFISSNQKLYLKLFSEK
jgi:glycosyltransferase involved in cell wall biosynthesis